MKLQRKSGLRAVTVGAVVVSGALLLSACGSDDNSGDGGTASASASAGGITCDGKGQLLASGSTAQQNAMALWTKNYMQSCSGTSINYKGIGSGAGIQEFLQGSTAFAGSDSALKPEEVTQSKKVCAGGQAVDLPMVPGPIGVIFHLEGVDTLVLDAPTLGKIFNGKITKWNDEAIKKLNPGASLPATAIQAFHRSDESGTTDNFTKYLIATAGSDFPYSGGKAWQAKGGQSAPGSSGVTAQVKQTNGAIGYTELSYATSSSVPTVTIDTGASAPVEATPANFSKAVADAKIVGTGDDLALQLNYATKDEGAYPIGLVTYEIACDKGNKAATLASMKSFLNYIAGEQGQALLTEQGYAPLPDEIAAKVRSAISSLS